MSGLHDFLSIIKPASLVIKRVIMGWVSGFSIPIGYPIQMVTWVPRSPIVCPHFLVFHRDISLIPQRYRGNGLMWVMWVQMGCRVSQIMVGYRAGMMGYWGRMMGYRGHMLGHRGHVMRVSRDSVNWSWS